MAAARRHALARRDRVMLAYVCIGGVNVDESDARALADLIGDTPVRLDLIDVTDPTGRLAPPGSGRIPALPRRPGALSPPAGRPPLFRRGRHPGGLRDSRRRRELRGHDSVIRADEHDVARDACRTDDHQA